MDLGLQGRIALVTGSWRGTGAGIAAVLAAEGATVLVHGLEPGQCESTLAAIGSAGGTCFEVVGDIRTDEGLSHLRASVDGVVDRVDDDLDVVRQIRVSWPSLAPRAEGRAYREPPA